MTITQLEYILAVNEIRHFGKASKACNVSQPTLSMQIQKLEDEIGIIIFDRSKNPIIPTDEGIAFIKQAKIVLAEFKKLNHVVDESINEFSGELKLAVIPTLSPYIVPLFANELAKSYPNLNLKVFELETEQIIEALDNDKMDVGLLVTPLHNDSLVERVLYYEPFKIYLSPNHSLYNKSEIKENEIDINDVWLLREGHCFRDQVLNLCSRQKTDGSKINFESGSIETLRKMALTTNGITILPLMAVQDLPTSQKKHVRDFSGKTPVREVSLVHARLFHKEKLINAVEQCIVKCLPPTILTHRKGAKVIEID